MQQGTWTIRPCPHRESSALARELDVSEITASVLVRRGYGDPIQARALLAGEQPLHDPFLLGDMAAAVDPIPAAIAAGAAFSGSGGYRAAAARAASPASPSLSRNGAASARGSSPRV